MPRLSDLSRAGTYGFFQCCKEIVRIRASTNLSRRLAERVRGNQPYASINPRLAPNHYQCRNQTCGETGPFKAYPEPIERFGSRPRCTSILQPVHIQLARRVRRGKLISRRNHKYLAISHNRRTEFYSQSSRICGILRTAIKFSRHIVGIVRM